MGDKLRTRGSAGSGAAVTVAMLVLLAGCAGSTRKPAASPGTGTTASAPVTTPAEVRNLDLQARGPGAVLRVSADRPLVWTNYRDRDGNLVVELPNSVTGPALADLNPTGGLISAVDVEALEDGDRPLVRLVVRTRGESEHSLATDGDALVLELLPVGYEAPAAVAVEPVAAEPERVAAQPPPPVGTPDSPHVGPPPTGVGASRLVAVDVQSVGGRTVVEVAGDGEFAYSTFRLQNPERFVLDLSGVVNTSPRATIAVPESTQVEQIRIGQFKPRPDPVSRVVFDLRTFEAPRIERTADGLTVTFGGGTQVAAAEPSPERVIAAAPPPSEAVPEPAAGEPAAEPPTEDVVADVEPEPAAAPPAVAADVPPPTVTASAPPSGRPPAVTKPVGGSDVALFEAQDVAVKPEKESEEALFKNFDTLVVNRTERQYVGEPISMSLRSADLVETLRSFAKFSDLNFVIQPGVRGTVTVELNAVPWDQALEQILKINNLGMDIDGTIVRIAPLETLRAEAQAQAELAASRQKSVALRTVLKSLSYASADSVASLLTNRTGSILSARGTVQIDKRTNTLIIREVPTNVDTVLAVIENLDLPEPQVTIEARIVEATKTFARSLGISWGFDGVADQEHGNTTGLVFPNNVTSDGGVALLTGGATGFLNLSLGNILNTFNLDARLQAAENEGLANIISAPRITTLNNLAATIQSGLQIPIQTVSNRTVTVQFVNATLSLNVVPHVTAEGTIAMAINVSKKAPQPGLAIAGSQNSPISTKDATTFVIVRDGGTAVIGGIYEVSSNQVQDRVPGLANVPIIGHLFKNRSRNDSNNELMIFVTPRIVQM